MSRVLPRLMRLRPDWEFELHSPPDVLRAMFGRSNAPWMHPAEPGYRARLKWEFLDLPAMCKRDPDALIYAPFSPLLNLALAPRTVHMSHNVLPLIDPGEWRDLSEPQRLLVLRASYVLAARAALGVVCVSRYGRSLLASLARLDEAGFHVIPHGADPLDEELRCQDPRAEKIRRGPYVLNVAAPVAYRRSRELILAYMDLLARRKDLPPLVIVGAARVEDRAYERDCLRLVAPLVDRGRAIVLGALPRGDVLALTQSAYAIVYPSAHEDCPNVVLEALSAGRPSVFADIPAARELADDAAVFVREPSPELIAEGIERAVFDEPLRKSLAAKAKARAALFTWDRTAELTAAALDR